MQLAAVDTRCAATSDSSIIVVDTSGFGASTCRVFAVIARWTEASQWTLAVAMLAAMMGDHLLLVAVVVDNATCTIRGDGHAMNV